MKKRNNEHIDDNIFKNLLKESKIEAGENLKYRIIQQIKTENSLRQIDLKQRKLNINIKKLLVAAVVMYGLIFLTALITILYGGKEKLMSPEFISAVIYIMFVCSIFTAINIFDKEIRRKFKKEK
ncbi:MAG: hypothetical protein ACLVKO_04470 [Dysgonomonas sp.]